MRRPKYEFWETEARDATELLRQALAVLLEQETARDADTVEGEVLFEALNTANRTKEAVWQWWEKWSVQTSSLKTSRGVALSVFRGCLPPLVCAVDVYGQSLAIFAISPDLEEDGDLAGRGVRVAKEVASFALQFLDDTPALRPVDRAAVDATLAALETRSKSLLALSEPIGSRVLHLRGEGRYGL
jgi:hypothetical protein